jgi:hypothetical protein
MGFWNKLLGIDLLTFHGAARAGGLDAVKWLVQKNPDFISSTRNGSMALHKAAENGHRDVVTFLLANKADVNAKEQNGGTPLHVAAIGDHKEVAALLLANKANVDARANGGVTALHLAALHGRTGVAALLLANRASVNAKDKIGLMPLHMAAVKGHKDMVELLLTSKAEVNAKNDNGQTPLRIAANREVAELLRQHGGWESDPDDHKRTNIALSELRKASNDIEDTSRRFDKLHEVAELLRQHGGWESDPDANERTNINHQDISNDIEDTRRRIDKLERYEANPQDQDLIDDPELVGLLAWGHRRAHPNEFPQNPDGSYPPTPIELAVAQYRGLITAELDKGVEFIFRGGLIMGIWLRNLPINGHPRTLLTMFCQKQLQDTPQRASVIKFFMSQLVEDKYVIEPDPKRGGYNVFMR